jgi:pimeloyl-ACP methyl ester carboxylesterase
VILLGHSLGGLLSMLVAHQHPELVKAVVVIDAPIVAGWRAGVLGQSKAGCR